MEVAFAVDFNNQVGIGYIEVSIQRIGEQYVYVGEQIEVKSELGMDIMSQKVKPPLAVLASHFSTPLVPFQFNSLLMRLERQQKMVRVLGPLLPTWET